MRTLNFKNTLLAIGLSAAIAHAQTPADKPGAANVPQSTPVQSQTEASTPKTDATTSTNAETDKAKHRKGSMSSTSPITSPAPDGSRNRLSSDEKSMLMGGDKKFANDVAEGGAMEVHLAQTAQQKSASDAVKEFAKKIEQDHSQANKELTEFAKMRAVDLPAAPEGKHKTAMDKLDALSGEQFDKAYIKMMIRDHKKDIKEFEKYSTTGMDTNLKAFAAKTLPTLQEHLRMAEELQRGGTTSSAKAGSTSTKNTAEHAEHAEDASTKTKKKVTSTDSGATPQATEPKQTTDPKP